ncbi:MAG: hypothetical protein DRP55_07375 [Spirochaetes bacterium]|nr:MAG: hypothetical protein DRP55_07375 [Spirochaetota bacterium]
MNIPFERFKEIIDRFEIAKVAVLGDIVADITIYGKPIRLSREAPVLIIRHDWENIQPGSGGNSVRNLASLGAKVKLIGIIGNDNIGRTILNQFKSIGVDIEGVIKVSGRFTVTKTRIMAGDDHTSKQQVIRIDKEPNDPISKDIEDKILFNLGRAIDSCDALLISDYGYGMITKKVLNLIKKIANEKIVVADSRYNISDFKEVDMITPNEAEALEAIKNRNKSQIDLLTIGNRLLKKVRSKAVLITRGNKGMVLFESNKSPKFIPICGSDDITDVTGAGDTVAAVAILSLIAGGSHYESARLANYAGGVVVMKPGAATVTKEELFANIKKDLNLNE